MRILIKTYRFARVFHRIFFIFNAMFKHSLCKIVEQCRKKQIKDDYKKYGGYNCSGCPPPDLLCSSLYFKALISSNNRYHNAKCPGLYKSCDYILNEQCIYCLLKIIVWMDLKGCYRKHKTSEDTYAIRKDCKCRHHNHEGNEFRHNNKPHGINPHTDERINLFCSLHRTDLSRKGRPAPSRYYDSSDYRAKLPCY